MHQRVHAAAVALALLGSLHPVAHAGNVLQTDISSIVVTGTSGVLRVGSVWAPAPAAAAVTTLFDGLFVPPNTTWNSGTFWWDELATGAPVPTTIEVQLNLPHTLDRFVVQGDDNESYQVDWWDGSAWQAAYTAGPVFTFGMETRDSGLMAAINTDRLRIHAFGGDAYYSLAEVQAFSVAAPDSLALAMLALGGLGLLRRRG